jgi:hypothetical protein
MPRDPVKLDFFLAIPVSILSLSIRVMCDVLFIVQELLMPCNTLAESEKIMTFCSESILSMMYSVSPIAGASAVNVDAI